LPFKFSVLFSEKRRANLMDFARFYAEQGE